MTTELRQALLLDALPVVQRKVALGSYPHAVYKKALDAKAWTCAQWLVHAYPNMLSAWDWRNVAANKNLAIEPDVVRQAHARGVEQNVLRGWKDSAVAWEESGVEFSLDFYEALWKTSGIAFKTRGHIFELGRMHRFGPVERWLQGDPVVSQVQDVYKQLWDHALLRCDFVLLQWLHTRTSRAEAMNHVHSCISARALALPSVLLRRATRIEWNVERFLSEGLAAMGFSISEFCQYVALYDGYRRRSVWTKISGSPCIPNTWREFFEADCKLGATDDAEQGLVLMLHALFPKGIANTAHKVQPPQEVLRMQHCYEARSLKTSVKVDLVDLL